MWHICWCAVWHCCAVTNRSLPHRPGQASGYVYDSCREENQSIRNEYDAGYSVGYDAGWDDGWEEGHIDGMADGYSEAYTEGYDAGYDACFDAIS